MEIKNKEELRAMKMLAILLLKAKGYDNTASKETIEELKSELTSNAKTAYESMIFHTECAKLHKNDLVTLTKLMLISQLTLTEVMEFTDWATDYVHNTIQKLSDNE